MKKTSYIITFIGDDKPGLVEQLSAIVERNRGNWHESRLSQLGGKFAGLVLVSLPANDGEQLQNELKTLSATGLSVRVTPTDDVVPEPIGKTISLSVLGPDRLGIVREISRALAEKQVNVVEMDSHVSSAAMSSESLFNATIAAQVPPDCDLNELVDVLDEIADQMTLEIELDN